MPVDTARASLASLAFVRTQATAETFDIEDEEDEESSASSPGHRRSNRLSTMFEHNDLINNQIAGLAQSIRQRNIPMPRRLSTAVHIEDETDSDSSHAVDNDAVGDALSDEQGQQEKDTGQCDKALELNESMRRKCTLLEAKVRQLEIENAELRASLASLHHKEGKDERRGSSGSNGYSSGDKAACNDSAKLRPELVAQSHAVGKVGLEKVALMVGKEQRKTQRAIRKKRQTITEVEQCESIVDQLLDTIDMLKTTVVKSPVPEANASLSSRRSSQLAKQVDNSGEEDGDTYISELRDAVGDFFSGIGLRTTPSGQETTSQHWQRQPLPSHRKLRDSTVMFV